MDTLTNPTRDDSSLADLVSPVEKETSFYGIEVYILD